MNQTITIPAGTTAGSWCEPSAYREGELLADVLDLAIDDDDDNHNAENSSDLDDYDLRFGGEGSESQLSIFDPKTDVLGTTDEVTIIEVTTPALNSKRQSNNNNDDDDELLLSPSNNTQVAAGSSFDLRYRIDDFDNGNNNNNNNNGQVRVALMRYWTGLQGNAGGVQTTSERASWEGRITIPEGLADGQYCESTPLTQELGKGEAEHRYGGVCR